MRKGKDIRVMQQPDNEVPTEVLAQSIKEISDGIKKLRAGRLNDRAIVLLVHKASGVNTAAVKKVIEGMSSLEREFLK